MAFTAKIMHLHTQPYDIGLLLQYEQLYLRLSVSVLRKDVFAGLVWPPRDMDAENTFQMYFDAGKEN